MNPDGMVALLNYRDDGVTREYTLILFHILISFCPSLHHILEARSQASQVVIVRFSCIFPVYSLCWIVMVTWESGDATQRVVLPSIYSKRVSM